MKVVVPAHGLIGEYWCGGKKGRQLSTSLLVVLLPLNCATAERPLSTHATSIPTDPDTDWHPPGLPGSLFSLRTDNHLSG